MLTLRDTDPILYGSDYLSTSDWVVHGLAEALASSGAAIEILTGA
ncbi:hypothetical protein [Streptomyces sp. NPDC096013]